MDNFKKKTLLSHLSNSKYEVVGLCELDPGGFADAIIYIKFKLKNHFLFTCSTIYRYDDYDYAQDISWAINDAIDNFTTKTGDPLHFSMFAKNQLLFRYNFEKNYPHSFAGNKLSSFVEKEIIKYNSLEEFAIDINDFDITILDDFVY